MSSEQHKLEETEDAVLESVDLEEADDPDEVNEGSALVEEEEVGAEAPGGAGSEEADQASWEELLAQRAASKRAADETDDVADLMSLSSEARVGIADSSPIRVAPVRDRQEFVCKRCHLVKPKTQLADEQRGFCRDCV